MMEMMTVSWNGFGWKRPRSGATSEDECVYIAFMPEIEGNF